MRFSLTVWNSYNELSSDFLYVTEDINGLSFSTLLPGGFGACSFSLATNYSTTVKWYREYIGKHLVLFDTYGRRVYEGRIASVNMDDTGVSVEVEGYYAHAWDLTHGLIYPVTTPTTSSDVIIDTVNLSTEWQHEDFGITPTLIDITPLDFTGEAKLGDAIDEVLKYGSSDLVPRPLHFAIWDKRIPYLFVEPDDTAQPDWIILRRMLVNTNGLILNRSRKDIYNKIQILYDDPYIGATFTDWYEDTDSQLIYGVREGSMNIGQSLADIADLVGQLAIRSYAYPKQSATVGVRGKISKLLGSEEYLYMVRAGQTVRFNDMDPTVSQLLMGNNGAQYQTQFIYQTTFKADTNELELDLNRRNISLDLMMARLGMSTGSIK